MSPVRDPHRIHLRVNLQFNKQIVNELVGGEKGFSMNPFKGKTNNTVGRCNIYL